MDARFIDIDDDGAYPKDPPQSATDHLDGDPRNTINPRCEIEQAARKNHSISGRGALPLFQSLAGRNGRPRVIVDWYRKVRRIVGRRAGYG